MRHRHRSHRSSHRLEQHRRSSGRVVWRMRFPRYRCGGRQKGTGGSRSRGHGHVVFEPPLGRASRFVFRPFLLGVGPIGIPRLFSKVQNGEQWVLLRCRGFCLPRATFACHSARRPANRDIFFSHQTCGLRGQHAYLNQSRTVERHGASAKPWRSAVDARSCGHLRGCAIPVGVVGSGLPTDPRALNQTDTDQANDTAPRRQWVRTAI